MSGKQTDELTKIEILGLDGHLKVARVLLHLHNNDASLDFLDNNGRGVKVEGLKWDWLL